MLGSRQCHLSGKQSFGQIGSKSLFFSSQKPAPQNTWRFQVKVSNRGGGGGRSNQPSGLILPGNNNSSGRPGKLILPGNQSQQGTSIHMHEPIMQTDTDRWNTGLKFFLLLFLAQFILRFVNKLSSRIEGVVVVLRSCWLGPLRKEPHPPPQYHFLQPFNR